jgi:hypothetical protein
MLQSNLRYPALILVVLMLAGLACNLPGSGPTATPEPPGGPDAAAPSDTPVGQEQPPGPPTDTPVPTATETATLVPTETFTPTPETPMVMVTVNTNCRIGPGAQYGLLGALLVGEKAEIVGVATSGPYVIIDNPDNPGELCWLWLEYAQITGEIDLAPLMTPPPTPTPEPFTVKSVTASVDVANSNGPCPFKFTFTAEIEVNRPGDVTYEWKRSDNASSPSKMISFTEAGKKSVTTTWQLGGGGFSYSGWQQLHIISPNDLLSNQANFSLNCP